MAYPTIGGEGGVTSWGTGGNFYATLLSKFSPMEAVITQTGSAQEITELGASIVDMTPGLRSWEATLSGAAFATPRLGNQGVASMSSGYSAHVYGWTLTMESAALDVTPLDTPPSGDSNNSTPISWRIFRPDYVKWSGRFTCGVDNTTALSVPTTPPVGTLPTLTLRYGYSGSSDASFSGAVVIVGGPVRVQRGAVNAVEYAFEGAGNLTAAGAASVMPTGAVALPSWSEFNTAVGGLVVSTKTGSRTLTGYDSFWRRITFVVERDSPTTITIEVQGSGSLVSA